MITGNVANANTPGFRAQAIQPFEDVLDKTSLQMVSTNPSHQDLADATGRAFGVDEAESWETTDSGNTVSLEQEMIQAGDVHRDYALNTNIVKAFHGMLMSSVKA